jgi:hypothetical protein
MGYCGTWGEGAFLVVMTGGGEGILGGMDVCVCVSGLRLQMGYCNA